MSTPEPSRIRVLASRLRHLKIGAYTTLVMAPVAAVIGAIVGGTGPAIGAAVGVAVVAVSFVISSVAVAWAELINPRLILSVGLITYAGKLVLLAVVMSAVQRLNWSGFTAMVFGIGAAALVWVHVQAIWVYRSRIFYVDVTEAR